MEYFLGIDGGGTKTACLLLDGNGKTLGRAEGAGSSHRQYGIANVVQNLLALAGACAGQAGVDLAGLTGVCAGLPVYGEQPDKDAELHAALESAFAGRLLLVNDVEVGWAGALACKPGINIVSGTGSIAFGRNEAGATARSGGWCEQFGDEGSSYWLALEGMRLFTKQADGRADKGPLYAMVKERWALANDFAFVPAMEQQLLPWRDKTAAFQKLLSDAADAGDATVPPLYATAAKELFELALAVKKALPFAAQPVPVSCTGGTFKAGAMILQPLAALLEEHSMEMRTPLLSPVQGAALYAAQRFAPACFGQAQAALLQGE